MADNIYPVRAEWRHHAVRNLRDYERMYQRSIQDPDTFWAEQAGRLDWFQPWQRVKNASFERDVSIRWYEAGKLNVSYNCIDRHLTTRAHQPAIIWEGDDPAMSQSISYAELYAQVCRFANVLKSLGVKKGDRVTLYMPMIPELAYALLACARIGAVHSVVFGGFSAHALSRRILDCQSAVVITADEGVRGGRTVPLKANVDAALQSCPMVKRVLVVRRTGATIGWNNARDVWLHEAMQDAASECAPEHMDAEDPLFILYTSGSTGAPKGVLHTTGGYLVYVSLSHEYVFDYRSGEIYWCTADLGWITGHSYVLYGPLANGATTIMFEGVPTHPNSARFWQVCDKHRVNVFYTAPTAIRALMRVGDAPVKETKRDSLRVLGTVGEPINPEAWEWYFHKVGDGRCPIVDTWWQTETGGIMMTPLTGVMDLKPGSVSRPFFGVQPGIVNAEGQLLSGACQGNLVLMDSWPGQMRTVYGDHARFVDMYFSKHPGLYFTGDGARRDKDGDYWVTGRIDDVINVSGHRLGTAEIESALVAHPQVAEAAVVGIPDAQKGQGIYAYVTLSQGVKPTDALRHELVQYVRQDIGPIATPDYIQWAEALPKTRSGKIMRRILRKIAAGQSDELGDVSTLAEPGVIQTLIEGCLIPGS